MGSNPAVPTIQIMNGAGTAEAGSAFVVSEVILFEEVLRWIGFGLCHQLPERSFSGGGFQVPVCARDEGMYLAFVVSLLLIMLLARGRRPSEMPPWPLAVLGVVFVAIMGYDGVTSYAGIRETTNDIRLITGILTGFALPLALAPILNGQLWQRPGPDRALGTRAEWLPWLVAVPATFAVAKWGLPLLGAGHPALAAAAILFTFTAVNLAIVALMPPFENRFLRLRDAWVPIVIAFGLTLLELWLTGLLRNVMERAAGSV